MTSNRLPAGRMFSHIYVEKKALPHRQTKLLLAQFPGAQLITIDHYKELFSRPRQNWAAQKSCPKLILAVHQGPFLSAGAAVMPDFGFKHFYSASLVMNCVYNCDYCYLQGMYSSADLVVFINIEDCFREAEDALTDCSPLYLCVSSDTDLLALEGLLGYCRRWIEFAALRRGLTLEIRTKSVNYDAISNIVPQRNVILAWTLSPQNVINRYEPGTPSLEARLAALNRAMADGWPVRLCFDPLLMVERWQDEYRELIDRVFGSIDPGGLADISIGTFRMNQKYLRAIQSRRKGPALLYHPFEAAQGLAGYNGEEKKAMLDMLQTLLERRVPLKKLWFIS